MYQSIFFDQNTRKLLWPDIFAFVFLAGAISLPSGYSWGATLITLLAIINIKTIIPSKYEKPTITLATSFIIFGVFWSQTFDKLFEFQSPETLLKYVLAALSLLYLSKTNIRFKSLSLGFIIAGFSALPIAFYQFFNDGRAEGYTNAIQFGDLAIFLSFCCFIFSISKSLTPLIRFTFALSSLSAFIVSVLSLSRGGWPFLLFFPVAAYFLIQDKKLYKKVATLFFIAVFIFVTAALQSEQVKTRVKQSQEEFSAYIQHPTGQAITSVGQRLEQWRLAWKLGKERPITGWGDTGLIAAKQGFVDQGEADPSVMEYGHAHNEWMDNWARRGGIGTLFLLAVYLVPFFIFFPTKNRLQKSPANQREALLQLRLLGVFLPIAYFVFGLTQCFFAHNSGHIFYLFFQIVLWSGISGLEKEKRGI